MDITHTAMDKLVNSLAFELEAIPQDNSIQVSNSPNMTPVSVKIRVRKKHDAGIQKEIISIPKYGHKDNTAERIKLASSDQTIMSFNMLMETDLEGKTDRKPKKYFFGRCLGAQYDDDDTPYTLSTVASTAKSESRILNKQFKLSKNTDGNNTSHAIHKKKRKLFGKCKPGGCLDPPFGEDNYAYQPKKDKSFIETSKDESISIDIDENGIETDDIKIPDKSGKQNIHKLNTLKNKNAKPLTTKGNPDNNSVLNLFQKESPQNLIEDKDSDSIITYPPDLSYSGLNMNDERLGKKSNGKRNSSASRSRKSFNEFSFTTYFSPKDAKNRDQREEEKGSFFKPVKIRTSIVEPSEIDQENIEVRSNSLLDISHEPKPLRAVEEKERISIFMDESPDTLDEVCHNGTDFNEFTLDSHPLDSNQGSIEDNFNIVPEKKYEPTSQISGDVRLPTSTDANSININQVSTQRESNSDEFSATYIFSTDTSERKSGDLKNTKKDNNITPAKSQSMIIEPSENTEADSSNEYENPEIKYQNNSLTMSDEINERISTYLTSFLNTIHENSSQHEIYQKKLSATHNIISPEDASITEEHDVTDTLLSQTVELLENNKDNIKVRDFSLDNLTKGDEIIKSLASSIRFGDDGLSVRSSVLSESNMRNIKEKDIRENLEAQIPESLNKDQEKIEINLNSLPWDEMNEITPSKLVDLDITPNHADQDLTDPKYLYKELNVIYFEQNEPKSISEDNEEEKHITKTHQSPIVETLDNNQTNFEVEPNCLSENMSKLISGEDIIPAFEKMSQNTIMQDNSSKEPNYDTISATYYIPEESIGKSKEIKLENEAKPTKLPSIVLKYSKNHQESAEDGSNSTLESKCESESQRLDDEVITTLNDVNQNSVDKVNPGASLKEDPYITNANSDILNEDGLKRLSRVQIDASHKSDIESDISSYVEELSHEDERSDGTYFNGITTDIIQTLEETISKERDTDFTVTETKSYDETVDMLTISSIKLEHEPMKSTPHMPQIDDEILSATTSALEQNIIENSYVQKQNISLDIEILDIVSQVVSISQITPTRIYLLAESNSTHDEQENTDQINALTKQESFQNMIHPYEQKYKIDEYKNENHNEDDLRSATELLHNVIIDHPNINNHSGQLENQTVTDKTSSPTSNSNDATSSASYMKIPPDTYSYMNAVKSSLRTSTQTTQSIILDLAFQSYINNNKDKVVKTLDTAQASQHPNDNITVIAQSVKTNCKEIRVPIDIACDMTIQTRKSIEELTRPNEMNPKLTIDHNTSFDSVQSVSFSGDEVNKREVKYNKDLTDEIVHDVLATIYEKELVPLQKMIKSLKDEIDALAGQQMLYRDRLLSSKIKPTRLLHSNKRCGCFRK